MLEIEEVPEGRHDFSSTLFNLGRQKP